MKALQKHDWVCCPTRHKWSCASCSVWWSHKWILFRNLNRCNRRCISGDLLLWAIGNERKQSFLSGFRQRERFCAGSQVFLWIRRQYVEPKNSLKAYLFRDSWSCSVLFLLSTFLGFFHGRSTTLQVWDLEASIHTPAKSLSTNNFVNFLRSEEPPVSNKTYKHIPQEMQNTLKVLAQIHFFEKI